MKIIVDLNNELSRRLRADVKRYEVTISYLVRDAIKRYLDHMDDAMKPAEHPREAHPSVPRKPWREDYINATKAHNRD